MSVLKSKSKISTEKSKKDNIEPNIKKSENIDENPNGIRLNVFLQERGVASRRKADELIARGVVAINGKKVTTLGTKVFPGMTVTVEGKVLSKAIPIHTYVFYKPDFAITSRKDPDNRPTIFDIPALKRLPKNVQSVGRLDFRSEGLLILTNDGNLAYALTHPRFSVEKRYKCLLNDEITPTEIQKLREGIELEDGLAKPVAVKLGSKEDLGKKQGHWIEITVTEGRNRLVRRMFAALGYRVIKLIRVAIGEINLSPVLKPEELMQLNASELKYLNHLKDLFLAETQSSANKSIEKKRRTRKPKGLSPLEYTEELARRSLELSQNERARMEQKSKPKASETTINRAKSSKKQ